ncbi:MAG: DUF2318 domain-containing protein [Candidatus Methanoperedens sp.]|nr:DUF2318 domain-containing protein [Candidatus Methanoperedens sp.]
MFETLTDMQNMPANCPMHGSDSKANARILAIKRSDGSIAVAYDVCALCGAAGYVQEGEQLICKRCGAPINPDTIGDEIVIRTNDVGEKADLFK